MRFWWLLSCCALLPSLSFAEAETKPSTSTDLCHTESGQLEDRINEQECHDRLSLPSNESSKSVQPRFLDDADPQLKRLLLLQRISSASSVDLPDDI